MKTLTKKPFLPPWIKSIPESQSHGSGTYQKRLWRLISDYVRLRDWYQFKGKCVTTGKYVERWQDGQAGHFKAYSKCNGMFKFDERNIHLQGASSNSWGDMDDWKGYERELKRRYGEEIVEELEAENRAYSLKFSQLEIEAKMELILEKMKDLEEQPEYYKRVTSLLPT